MATKKDASANNVKVMMRVRPLNEKEKEAQKYTP
jgi:hypothetical protein